MCALPEELAGRAAEVFGWISGGALSVSIGARYQVSDLARAFEALESRATTGKIVLEH